MFFKEFYQFKNLLMKMLCVFGQTLNINKNETSVSLKRRNKYTH